MPQDAYTISYLSKELNLALQGSKITKINQPEKDELSIFLYTKNGNKKMVISTNGNTPRCHLTIHDKPNPITAPSFCMLLRKHLLGGTITNVLSPVPDRIIELNINSKNEMQDDVSLKLIIELMSRQSNVILIGTDNRIIGALKSTQIDDENAARTIMCGAKYRYPTQNKIAFNDLTEIYNIIDNFVCGSVIDYLNNSISGYAYATFAEILYKSGISIDSKRLNETEKDNLIKIFNKLNDYSLSDYTPSVGKNNDKTKDYYLFPYECEQCEYTAFDSISDAADSFYFDKDNALRIKEHSKKLQDIIKNNISRSEKKLSAQKKQMIDSEDLEKDRLYGELITSNMYRVKFGDKYLIAENYYNTPSEQVKIPLNENLSPAKNAQNYYKRYAKKKRTIDQVSKQIIETTSHLEMLENIFFNLKNISDTKQLSLINDDLINAGIVKKEKAKGKQKPIKSSPYEYSFCGYTIFVGRNSTENEYVTHKLGKNKDMWFHVKRAFGCHVLMKYEGISFTDEAYIFAAELAAFFSENRYSDKVEIDYTEIKNVKKPPNGKLGLVIYNTNYSMSVTPNEHLDYRK